MDISIILTGSQDAAYTIAKENNLSMDDEVPAGMEVNYSGGVISEADREYIAKDGITPATALDEETKKTVDAYEY